jgi:hypothetical protein
VVSSATLTLIGTPDRPERGELAVLRLQLALAEQQYGGLLRAAQAALAADAAGMARPLGWLRDALTPEQLPGPGARPNHFVPLDAQDAVWGRW